MTAPVPDAKVLCDQRAEHCRCREDSAHDGPHVCPCGGSWLGVLGDESFEVVEWPKPGPAPLLRSDEDW